MSSETKLKKEVSVSEIVDIFIGGTPNTSINEYWEGDIPWASAKDVANCESIYIEKTEKRITQKGVENSAAKILPKDTIVITSRGTVGKICMLPFPMSFNQTCYGLVAKKGVVQLYLLYKLKSMLSQIDSLSYGTVFDTITKKTFDELKFSLPSENEQRAIASILGSLDDKLALNRQMNSTLEAIGQALFRRWFVELEFPDEEGKPYRSSGGEMVDSELGEVPRGWEVKPFSEVIDVNPNRKLAKGKVAKKVGMAGLNTWQSWIESWQLEKYKSGPRFQNGDTLFARITPSLEHGKTAFVSFLDKDEVAFGSTEFIIFAPKIIESDLYIFYLARSEDIREAAISAMTGSSGRQRVPEYLFDQLLICVPPPQIIAKFHNAISLLFEEIAINANETRYLSKIRDVLLPKLMSGEIKVR